MHLVVYSKPGCPLCDEGLEVLEALAAEHPHTVEVRNILTRDDWFARYRHDVPVVELDGQRLAALRFTADDVREALKRQNATPKPPHP